VNPKHLYDSWHTNKEARRARITEKVELLRERIEGWCNKNGYDKMDYHVERKNEKGEIYYKYSDWEFVDDAFGNLMNDDIWLPHSDSLIIMNKLWNRYK
jgi:hypothetical protein